MDDVEIEVLSLATEDYYGLWELTVQIPVARDRLAQAIEGLVGSGLVEWYYRTSDTAQAVPEGNLTPRRPDLAAIPFS
ncbi:hypothetical protein N802_05470 [Knoellia sinensis KCTC 19936]|uniref:Uncharacterized protein n=1 Tax=Knoellia sinensis KCTC 19936 TaxID=1385520 RepID=A0A0A0J2C3_9MICO|nr:hypothetical protein N802_05470 [Knoellia sinensis KCTC 19936]